MRDGVGRGSTLPAQSADSSDDDEMTVEQISPQLPTVTLDHDTVMTSQTSMPDDLPAQTPMTGITDTVLASQQHRDNSGRMNLSSVKSTPSSHPTLHPNSRSNHMLLPRLRHPTRPKLGHYDSS